MPTDPATKPKRFYAAAGIEAGGGAYVLTLDGRPARTPGRAPLALPTEALGRAVAAEWDAQRDVIDPATMPLTRLANTAIDGVARDLDAVRADIVKYAKSDLVFYRAGEPASLVAAQAGAWDPVLAWAREALGARFILSEGVMFVAQPEASVARVADRLASERSPVRLAALHVATTLTGSVLLALMAAAGAIGRDEAWEAAHVDDLYQEARWGADEEARERRRRRKAEFDAAAQVLASVPA